MSQIQLVILRRWKAAYPLESQYLSVDPKYLEKPPFSSISEAILWRSKMLLLIRSSFCAITSSPFRRFSRILEISGRFFVFLPDTCSSYNFTSPALATAFHWATRFWSRVDVLMYAIFIRIKLPLGGGGGGINFKPLWWKQSQNIWYSCIYLQYLVFWTLELFGLFHRCQLFDIH